MVVNYFGNGCFRLQSGDTSLVVNPTSNRFKADAVLRTLMLVGEPVLPDEIAFPGEYEVKGIEIQGWPLKEESTAKIVKSIFMVTWEDTKFLFLGHVSKSLPPDVLEEVGDPDLVFIPTGDDHFIPAEEAVKLIKRLEPKIVIPAFYKNANALVKAMGKGSETQDKFVFRRKDLGEEAKAKLIILESKG